VSTIRRTDSDRELKKAFRMEIVNQIKDLTPKMRAKKIEELISRKHEIPYSSRDTLSKTTIYRWLEEVKTHKEDLGKALKGKVRRDRNECKVLTSEQQKALKRWRYDNPYRTAKDLQEELMAHAETKSPTPPSESTIARFLKANNLGRADLIKYEKPKVRLAFEAEYPQQIWMADTKGPDVYVEDPQNPGKKILAKPIIILDARSRYLVAKKYVTVENQEVIMELFRQAVEVFGIPEILYVDRGSPYMGKNLKRAASLIGCNIIHTKPRDAAAKGRIEKCLRTCHERFEHEMAASGKKAFLTEYNRYLEAYVAQDYHRRVHTVTGQTPEECFFAFPANLRRWIAKDDLTKIFLPVRTARVSKTALVRINNLQYLVSDASLVGKKVEVRHEYFQRDKIYVWYQDKYYGEAYVYLAENDFIKREELMEKIHSVPEIELPAIDEVPLYSRLDRQLAKHRAEMEQMEVNVQLEHNRNKKEEVRASLVKPKTVPQSTEGSFEAEEFIYLLMRLLRKKFTPSERLAAHVLWNAIGPIKEQLVRKTVGRLLGEEHPAEDVSGYLEEIRINLITQKNN